MNTEIRNRLSAITILYLLLAIADEDFQLLEAEQILVKLKEWLPDIIEDDLVLIIDEAQELLANKDQTKLFKFAAETINKHFDEDNKVNVLRDLINIALVDNDLSKFEFNLIQKLIKVWNLYDKVDVTEYINHLRVMKEVEKLEQEQKERIGSAKEKVTKVKQNDIDSANLPDELIAEVSKIESNYQAKIMDTENDVTDLIDNPAKLKYAFDRSGLVRGKRDKYGIYVWRVISKLKS